MVLKCILCKKLFIGNAKKSHGIESACEPCLKGQAKLEKKKRAKPKSR